MALDEPVIVAVAALAGSLVGACSSVAATFIGQRLQARWAQLRTELEELERLYGIFVEESVHLFADSIQRSAIEPAKIMRLYSKVARIRLASTDQSFMRPRRWSNGCLKLMNGRRRIQRKFSRDTPTAKAASIPYESLQKLAGSKEPRLFNRSDNRQNGIA
jgi:hypothetical protein